MQGVPWPMPLQQSVQARHSEDWPPRPGQEAGSRSCPTQPQGWPLFTLWTRSGIWYYGWMLEPKSIQNSRCKGVGKAHWLASAVGRGASQETREGTMT